MRNYGDFRQHVIPVTITCMLRGTPCDTGFSYTFYRGNICSVSQCLYQLFLVRGVRSLSGEFSATQAQSKVLKIKNLDFSYWAWSTPWGHVLSLKTFCRNPVLSWAIRYSVFQPVKFVTSLSSCAPLPFQLFDIWWSSLDKINDFKAISRIGFFRFGEINKSLFWVFSKKNIFHFCLVGYYISKGIKNNDLFISPKWKKTGLEMVLKSFI